MARVTIGVPVYNGAPMLRDCLDCLLTQTFHDFEILISDNASTDETPEICAEYAAKDARIKIIRQEKNIGALGNFRLILDKAQTEFFMWRADDDYSKKNYVEELLNLLQINKKCNLAVSAIETEYEKNKFRGRTEVKKSEYLDYADRVIHQLYNYHASWFYGLWRTSYIQETVQRVWSAYPEAYAGDHLTLLPAILDEAVTGTNKTLFVQRTYSPIKGDGMRGRRTLEDRISMLERLMPLFYSCYDAEIARHPMTKKQKHRLLKEKKSYTYHKLRASPWRIFRLKVKKMLGKQY